MRKLINHLPEIAALIVLVTGLYSVISKSVASAAGRHNLSLDYTEAFFYIGVAVGTLVVLKAIQTIVNELFNSDN